MEEAHKMLRLISPLLNMLLGFFQSAGQEECHEELLKGNELDI